MKPEQLHRNHLTALISGDHEKAANLRGHFSRSDHDTAVQFLRAATAISLEYRFGPGAGLGAGPVDYDELAAFMAEARRMCEGTEPPPDFLAVEAVVRSLYGEPHLIEPLRRQQHSQALYLALTIQTRHHPWLAAHPDWVLDRAKQTSLIWLLS